jgi:hypothetical protein
VNVNVDCEGQGGKLDGFFSCMIAIFAEVAHDGSVCSLVEVSEVRQAAVGS